MAGAKQEVVNTFEKGLVMDLNPINTPNNVLTDCVNGTLITYDGNEYQLQNDKGNYLLKYCKLPKDFVPIGTASYGDILYIVSYNPLTKETQVGTFPSPAQLSQITLDGDDFAADSILSKYLSSENVNEDVLYTDLLDKFDQLIQFGATEDYKVYPGDEYNFSNVSVGHLYEYLRYFILTDENELIEITDQIKNAPEQNKDGFRTVTWEVPGWFAVRWALPLIEDCKIYPKSINPETGDAVINYRVTANDEEVERAYVNGDLLIETDGANQNGNVKSSIDSYDTTKYFNLTYPLKYNLSHDNTTLEIKARPVIHSYNVNDLNERAVNIKYPDAEAYIVDLKNTFSQANTKIAQEYFTYKVDNESNTITFSFDVDASVVTSGEITLKLSAIKYTDYVDANYPDVSTLINWSYFANGENLFDGVGQQIIQVPILKGFEENIYILRIELTDGLSTVYDYKTVINSELINNFTRNDYSDFNKIPVPVWSQYLADIDVDFNESAFVEPSYTKQGGLTIDSKQDDAYWTIDCENETSGFFPEDSDVFVNEDVFDYKLNYKATGGHVEGEIKQKYLYNFCTIVLDKSSYNVTGCTDSFTGNKFSFTPNGIVNPKAVQTFKAIDDYVDYSANTVNFKLKDLSPVWDNKTGIYCNAYKKSSSGTNIKIKIFEASFLKLSNYTELAAPMTANSINTYTDVESSVLNVTATNECAVIKQIIKSSECAIVPSMILLESDGTLYNATLTSNYYKDYVTTRDDNDAIIFGLLINDSISGPLFVPAISYSNQINPNDKLDIRRLGEMYKFAIPNTNDNWGGFNLVSNLLDSIRINTKKLTNTNGYFLQKTEASREILTKIPIEINGTVTVGSVVLNNKLKTNLETIKNQKDIFYNADLFRSSIKEQHINTISKLTYNVKNSDGSILNTSDLDLAMNDTVEKSKKINNIVMFQYNNYPKFDLIKYTNAGRSIGYVNINQDTQPGVSKFVDDILRENDTIVYNNNVNVRDVRVNSSEFDKMYLTSQTDNDTGNEDMNFENLSDERRDPRIAIFYSVTDPTKILRAYWSESNES